MKARELMQSQVLTLASRDRAATAVQLMLWTDLRQLPLVDGGRLVGWVDVRELLSALAEDTLPERLAHARQRKVQPVHPDDEVSEVAARMIAADQHCLPVVETGRFLGLVTMTDLLAHFLHRELAAGTPTGAAREVMTAHPEVARPDDPLLDAMERMTRARIRHLPVVDTDGRVVAMLSDRDVRTAIGDQRQQGAEEGLPARMRLLRVRDVARAPAIVIRDGAPLSEVAQLLNEHRIGALPVVDAKDRLVGIVSYVDLVGARGPSGPVAAGPPAHPASP